MAERAHLFRATIHEHPGTRTDSRARTGAAQIEENRSILPGLTHLSGQSGLPKNIHAPKARFSPIPVALRAARHAARNIFRTNAPGRALAGKICLAEVGFGFWRAALIDSSPGYVPLVHSGALLELRVDLWRNGV